MDNLVGEAARLLIASAFLAAVAATGAAFRRTAERV